MRLRRRLIEKKEEVKGSVLLILTQSIIMILFFYFLLSNFERSQYIPVLIKESEMMFKSNLNQIKIKFGPCLQLMNCL